jgi:uncharacterized delta-60 repeat protein
MKFPPCRVGSVFSSLLLVVVYAFQVTGQTAVDPTYNGIPSLPLSTPVSLEQAIQADGKILIWGRSLAVQGIAKGKLVRLNSNGELDNTFMYCHCGLDGMVNALPLPDGKILVAGFQSGVSKVTRLNKDGSLDGTFSNSNPAILQFGASSARVIAVQPDGKFYTYRTQAFQGFGEASVFRFNPDGSLDSSFTSVGIGSGSPNFTTLSAFLLAPDGKIYVASNTYAPFSSSSNLRRRNADGTADASWTMPDFQPSNSWSINGLGLQADGGLLVSGDFASVNGVSKIDLVRIMPAGNVDLDFTAGQSFISNGQIQVLSNGGILYSSRTDISGITTIFRLTPTGGVDGSFSMAPEVSSQLNVWVLDASERIVFLGSVGNSPRLVRLLTNGDLDTSFDPDVNLFGRIHAIARQSDGKFIVAGEFNRFNGKSRSSLVRTNSDGTLDTSFDAGTGFNTPPRKIIVQPDGKVLAIGSFTTYNGTPVPGIVRLLTDGALDLMFSVTPNAGQIRGITLMADGRMLIGGSFSTINGISRPGVARLDAEGSVDLSFDALLGGSPTVNDVVVQPDGKIVIGGSFSGVAGFNRSNFVRLEITGALDQPFNPSVGIVGGVWLTADNKFLIVGPGGDSITIQRRNSDGSPDGNYTSQTFFGDNSQSFIDAVLVQSDGSAIVGGNYYTVGSNARKGIVRLAPNGSVDPLFLPRSADGRVRAVIDGGVGKVMIGGDFSLVESTTRAGLSRLNVTPFRKVTLFDFDGDGRSDFTVFRPSTNDWYSLLTSTFGYTLTHFGSAGDIVAPGDYDGDGKTDPGIYRPSTGAWWYAASSLDGAHRTVSWGVNGDIPRPADFDGDGKTDFILFRPSNNTWYRMNSSGAQSTFVFGSPGDQPVVGDFDGDGKWDPAIFRPSSGDWWYAASSAGNQHRSIHWGTTGDIPAPADFDGDGKTDFAVFRPSEGGWYVWNSGGGPAVTTAFGLSADVPIPADYDGDGKADIAVFRPSNGVWYLLQSTAGIGGVQWGLATDVAIPNAFVPH